MYQKKLKLSLLDYSPVDEGLMPHDALSATVRLAQSAEKNGFHRYWVSEHHGMPAISGNSPEILMARIASATQKIRLGSGAVLLPNYSSLKIAENYQLLESLFPNRIDLGFGRAPGADSRTGSALNDEKGRTIPYPQKVSDLIGFITGKHSENSHYAGMKAYPETNTKPQPFVLGASGSTAQFAAKMGLGFTFAHFINPGFTGPHAADEYRDAFQKSDFSENQRSSFVYLWSLVILSRKRKSLLMRFICGCHMQKALILFPEFLLWNPAESIPGLTVN